MKERLSSTPTLSACWRRSVLLVFVVGMIGLIFMDEQWSLVVAGKIRQAFLLGPEHRTGPDGDHQFDRKRR